MNLKGGGNVPSPLPKLAVNQDDCPAPHPSHMPSPGFLSGLGSRCECWTKMSRRMGSELGHTRLFFLGAEQGSVWLPGPTVSWHSAPTSLS